MWTKKNRGRYDRSSLRYPRLSESIRRCPSSRFQYHSCHPPFIPQDDISVVTFTKQVT
jgi:hypothetical protein